MWPKRQDIIESKQERMCLRRAQLSVPGSITRDEIGYLDPSLSFSLSVSQLAYFSLPANQRIDELRQKSRSRRQTRGGGGKRVNQLGRYRSWYMIYTHAKQTVLEITAGGRGLVLLHSRLFP